MKCTNCGAHLTDEDLYCPRCGAKTIKDRRCPGCGAILREDTNFCHKCGRPVSGNGEEREVTRQTLDIPIDVIERNILSETAAEIGSDQRTETATPSHKSAGERKLASSGKKISYREDDWDEDDEDDWDGDDEDDWDEDEDDPDEDDEDGKEGADIITIMTVVMGCVILVVIALLGFHFYRQYTSVDQEDEIEEQQPGQDEEQETAQDVSGDQTMTLTVIKNVNVRDNPSTSGSNVLKVAKEGETYECTGSTDGGEWYMILLEDGTTGYVFHEYVTVE